MRFPIRLTLLLATLASAAAAATTATAADAVRPSTFVLTGGGWGHGVGMSQWGAFGQAKSGRGYHEILAHYYPGTERGTAPTALSKVRVLIGDGLTTAVVSSARPFVVRDAAGAATTVPAGELALGPGLKLPPDAGGETVALAPPLVLRPASGAYLAVGGKGYRGELRVERADGRLRLVNTVALEAYLRGVVAGEMPKDWPLEALKAQAVAARTYALANVVKGKTFDLYSDWRSQMYHGVAAEGAGPTRAVAETRGEILTFGGKPAQTLYFSSSGGRTLSSLDAFGTDFPYLVSVDDPWDDGSPDHRWAPRVLSGAELAKPFELASPVADAVLVPGAPGKPAVLRLTTVAGASVDARLSDVRARLGLRSGSFRLGVLRLDRAPGVASRAAGVVRLTGLARDVDDALLERRDASGAWVVAKRLAPGADGAFAVALRPKTTTAYRLSTGGLAGPALTVRVQA